MAVVGEKRNRVHERCAVLRNYQATWFRAPAWASGLAGQALSRVRGDRSVAAADSFDKRTSGRRPVPAHGAPRQSYLRGRSRCPARRAASSPESRSIRPAPVMVWATKVVATDRGRPMSTPPSIIASATRKMYAGPDPETPVTVSSSRSSTRSTSPTADRMLAASRGPQRTPRHTGDGRRSTTYEGGVFGMDRTTATVRSGAPSFSAASIEAVRHAGATERTRSTLGANDRHTSATWCGLTEISAPFDFNDGGWLSTTHTSGNNTASSLRRSADGSTTIISAAVHQPPERSPPISASPIFPPPTTASETRRQIPGSRSPSQGNRRVVCRSAVTNGSQLRRRHVATRAPAAARDEPFDCGQTRYFPQRDLHETRNFGLKLVPQLTDDLLHGRFTFQTNAV